MRKETEDLSQLTRGEKLVVSSLGHSELPLAELAKKAMLNPDSASRASRWLEQKGFALIREEKSDTIELGNEGIHAAEHGLDESNLLKSLSEEKFVLISEVKEIPQERIGIALGHAKKKNWIEIKENTARLTAEGKSALRKESAEQEFLRGIGKSKIPVSLSSLSKSWAGFAEELSKRPGFLKIRAKSSYFVSLTKQGIGALSAGMELRDEINQLTPALIKSGDWKKKEFRNYNLSDPVQEAFAGRRQPYIRFLDIVREKLVSMGFTEMPAPLVVTEFFNFDVLFQPQDHPARTWTDTYQLLRPAKGKLPDKATVAKVKSAHESGGISDSRGWQYEWSEDIASRLMPAAHGTAHSARQIVKGVSVPGKYFAIARCFRPDVLDATHLIEFNQLEGFVVGEDINFRHLLGLLRQFAEEVAGAQEVKFLPDYYPFTEPSVQMSAKHPKLGWIEFGGAGMFRPEMLENLGVKGNAIAWGLGVDRLALSAMETNDVRNLFSQDLGWLRSKPLVELE
ncbi:MAG: phenylalanine--tRNA ligase subunit alpha [archaeon]